VTPKKELDRLVSKFEKRAFIETDPISIPHSFDSEQDIEVIGLYAASLAWGQRVTILNKMAELCERMSYKPYEFVLNVDKANRLEKLEGFKHRTFQPEDALHFTRNLSSILKKYGSVQAAFCEHNKSDLQLGTTGQMIQGFSSEMMSINEETPTRLGKHLARPLRGSACKRLNMYLRWMTRSGEVDFGIWSKVDKKDLVLPLDVHSGTQARKMGYLTRKQNDWKAAMELTENCRALDPKDPCKYDFAFYGSGAFGDEEPRD